MSCVPNAEALSSRRHRSTQAVWSPGSPPNRRHRESAADLPSEYIGDLGVPRHRFNGSGRRVGPERMRPAFSLQVAAVLSQVTEQFAPFHPTTTFSRIAAAGILRRPSFRLSSRISAIASARFFSAAAFVLPWPFAPGISGQYAIYQRFSRSTIAVNSFRISLPTFASYPITLQSGSLFKGASRFGAVSVARPPPPCGVPSPARRVVAGTGRDSPARSSEAQAAPGGSVLRIGSPQGRPAPGFAPPSVQQKGACPVAARAHGDSSLRGGGGQVGRACASGSRKGSIVT